MDRLGVFGLFLGVISLLLGFALEGGAIAKLIQPSSFIIVIGGSIGAALFQSTRSQLKHLLASIYTVFSVPDYSPQNAINEISEWASLARQQGFLVLEPVSETHSSAFVRNGLSLLIDGNSVESIESNLSRENGLINKAETDGAVFFNAVGGYSPTIGILGAVFGLIQAMSHIDEPALLGMGVASAFVATVYGVGFANLLFIPLAHKVQAIADEQFLIRELYQAGIIGIARGDSPLEIELSLAAYNA